MKLKALQWNINGAKIRAAGADPTKGPGSQDPSYIHDDLEYIISKIREWDVDFITLQETHANDAVIQAQVIAERLGFPYWVNDRYDASHLEKGQSLCQSIISKYPTSEHSFEFFNNPNFKTTAQDGSTWMSHDKGCTSVQLALPDGHIVTVITVHLIPFRPFGLAYDNPQVAQVLQDVSEKILAKTKGTTLIQGDFNIDAISLKPYLPLLFAEIHELEAGKPTTPGDSRYDHVLYKALRLISTETSSDVLTDHFPVISEFEI